MAVSRERILLLLGAVALVMTAPTLLREISAVPEQRWVLLGLPAATGLFLSGLALFMLCYGMWLLVGMLAQVLAVQAGRWGCHQVAGALRSLSPRIVQRAFASTLSAGLLLGGPVVQAAANGSSYVAAQPTDDQRAEDHQEGGGHRRAEVQVPLATWTPRTMAVPLQRAFGAQPPTAESRSVLREVIVASGDTLWDIARTRLGPTATISDVASYWPRIHALNREVIGPNPDLLRIGTVLQLPNPNS